MIISYKVNGEVQVEYLDKFLSNQILSNEDYVYCLHSTLVKLLVMLVKNNKLGIHELTSLIDFDYDKDFTPILSYGPATHRERTQTILQTH